MSLPPAVARCLGRVRQAAESGGMLRCPGGNTVARVLDLMAQGDLRQAAADLSPLLDAAPLRDLARLLSVLILEAQGDRARALDALAGIVHAEDTGYDVLCLAGELYGEWNMPADGRKAYDRAIGRAAHASHAHLRRGRLNSLAGDVTAAIADLQRATLLQPDLAEAHLALGHEYRDASMADAAIASYREALALDPDNLDAAIALDTVMTAMIPPWHAAMLNDAGRNDAYDAAIRRAVRPGAHVLDIGTGTGLLAMMAARAGAAHVTACEAVGVLAEAAREIIARNGLSDRVTVVHKRSTALEVGRDLPRPADILVSEIFDAGLLTENILESATDAKARLLAPAAQVIPRGAAVFAVPIECAAIAAERRVSTAAGFDVSPFNALAPRHYLQCDLARYDWRPLAEAAMLFEFDFTGDRPDRDETAARVIPLADGTAHAVALWFRLALDDETAIATGPADPPTHWRQAVYALDPPVELKLNEPARLVARHNGRKIVVALTA